MRRPDLRLWQVVADPLSYHPRWRGAEAAMTADQRSAVNAALVAELALAAPNEGDPLGLGGRRLIAAWSQLGLAVDLLAMAKQPRSAQAHRDFLAAPALARQFMQLGFPASASPAPQPMSRSELRAWGAGYLLAGLGPSLPAWLAQRVALLFDCVDTVPGVSPEAFDHSCFWSALSHAQTATPACGH